MKYCQFLNCINGRKWVSISNSIGLLVLLEVINLIRRSLNNLQINCACGAVQAFNWGEQNKTDISQAGGHIVLG